METNWLNSLPRRLRACGFVVATDVYRVVMVLRDETAPESLKEDLRSGLNRFARHIGLDGVHARICLYSCCLPLRPLCDV